MIAAGQGKRRGDVYRHLDELKDRARTAAWVAFYTGKTAARMSRRYLPLIRDRLN
jgi:hypothetical protein